jgi:hypothetical protein
MYTALSKLCHQVIPQLLFNCRFFYFLKCNNTSCGGFENKRQILRRPSEIWPTRTFRRRGFCRTRVDCSRSWTPSARNLKWTECDWGIWTTRPSRARMPDTDGISIRDSPSPIESVSLHVYRTLYNIYLYLLWFDLIYLSQFLCCCCCWTTEKINPVLNNHSLKEECSRLQVEKANLIRQIHSVDQQINSLRH